MGQGPQRFALSGPPSSEATRAILADSQGNRAFAQERLADINALMLGKFPFTLELLQQQSAATAEHLRRTDPHGSDLKYAVDNYRSCGDHILMSAIICGHKTLRDFLHASMPGQYPTDDDEKVQQWCEEFLLRYVSSAGVEYTPQDVMARFENDDELQREARLLDKFLKAGPPIADACVMKGIGAISDGETAAMSTRVAGRDYVRAFLSGQPIMYDGFLSTAFDPKAAADFAGGDPSTRPVYAIDFADRSGRSEALRRHALADLSNPTIEDQAASIMLAIRTRQARGAVLDSSAAPGIADETELLLASGHVLAPVMAIRCEKGYVLLADAYHRDFVQ
ncbi:hypothetical protein GCM10027287_27140 [Bordetella muralis]